MLKKTLAVFSLLAAASANAGGFDRLNTLAQSQFDLLAKDLGSALSYKALSPGDPLGLTGFDIGAEVTATKLKSATVLEQATGEDLTYLPVPKLHAHKGLPFDIDVGAFYAKIPSVDIKLTGAELRWAPIAGNLAVPAVAVRATYTKLSGVDQLDFNSTGIEATVSKGFLLFKPYIGAGYVRSKSTPHVGALSSVTVNQGKFFGGVNINTGLLNFALEADKTGDDASYGLKLGLRF